MPRITRIVAGETVTPEGRPTVSTPIYDQLVAERGSPLADADKKHEEVCPWSGHKVWPNMSKFL